MQGERIRPPRGGIQVNPHLLPYWATSDSAWHETPAQQRRRWAHAQERARLLRWVRVQMARRLSARERHCIELYYFEGLTYKEIGQHTGTNASSAFRAVARALAKLRLAAAEDGPQPPPRAFR